MQANIAPSEGYEKLELYFSCMKLPDKDVMSKSDPFISCKVNTRGQTQQIPLGQTETLRNNLNPQFQRPITVNYFFESVQNLFIECRDDDGGGSSEILGTATCTISQILMSPSEGLTLPLVNSFNKDGAKVTIRYIKIGETKKNYSFKIRCSNVKDIEIFSKSDPFLRIYRPSPSYENGTNPESIPQGGWIQIHETEYYQDNLNPTFLPFSINGAQMNRGVGIMVNRWEIWDHSHRGKHELIGWVHVSTNEILNGKRSLETKDKKGKFAGTILFDDIREVQQFPITDYIKLGLNLNLTIGVDFTGSNGVQKSPTSLHYMGNNLNQYQNAIMEVGMVVIDYDYDKMVPAYGFGAKLPGTSQANFCFPLNGNPQNPFTQSYQGVLQAYNHILPSLEFAGPTNFAPIINETVKAVKAGFQQNKMVYSILMILTDGLISDFRETTRAIVEASSLPMSIIIIGVGNEQFDQMDQLDSDKGMLKDDCGRFATRDIVQFVPFRDYAHNPPQLAAAVLQELPKQIDQFYQGIGIVPKTEYK